MSKHTCFGTSHFYTRALSIALPVMAQLLVQSFVSLIDNFMVAGLGDIKMAGVNTAGMIIFVFIILVNTLCSAGGIFMSQFRGAKDSEGMQQSLRFKLLLTGTAGLAFTIIGLIAPRGLFRLMLTVNTDAEPIIDQAVRYSRAVAFSGILMVFSQSLASSLREIEIVRPPLVISVIATLVNTFFNWVFIFGNLGSPRLEVEGAGIATVIARAAELILFIAYVTVKKPPFLFNLFKLFNIKVRLFGTIIKKSTMILYSELTWALAETVSTALYNTRGGAEVVSGMSAGFAIANLFFICFSGIVTASSVILGQELGAGKLQEAKRYKNWILSGSVLFGLIFMAAGFCTVWLIPFVFKNLSRDSQAIARGLIITAAAYLPLWAYLNAQYAISRTGGDTTMGVICDTVANILFVGGIFLLVRFTVLGPVVMYAIVKTSDVVKAVIAHFWLKKERWLVNLTSDKK
ncbi:MATE family efflux transporter [Treponema sp. Marseille-Q4132]|uniref:MATE family efflux transporter n=1 Tax=Treponema sp. Marseille-Q4132 TaxID=2766701 RepID=UPI0016532996|nr:MATE family efflux transporter [Treponema sp. Marseille-Q4132]QNL96400.1 MATE family efflux transporter [Treponema sp. Marseille-Q4132]